MKVTRVSGKKKYIYHLTPIPGTFSRRKTINFSFQGRQLSGISVSVRKAPIEKESTVKDFGPSVALSFLLELTKLPQGSFETDRDESVSIQLKLLSLLSADREKIQVKQAIR